MKKFGNHFFFGAVFCFTASMTSSYAANITTIYDDIRQETTLYRGWSWIRGDVSEAAKTDYTGESTEVTVPHDWQILETPRANSRGGAAQGFFTRQGIAWYRTNIDLPENVADSSWQLAFDSVFERPSIYVNGELVGKWHYGYMSFHFDITKFIKSGKNTIAVRVDNTDPNGSRWYSGAGITGKVRLIKTGKSYIDEYGINVITSYNPESNAGQAKITVDPNSETKDKLTLDAELSYDGQTVKKGKGVWNSNHFELTFDLEKPHVWSADTPNLYQLKLVLKDNGKTTDIRKINIGIRTVQFLGRNGGGMVVNGKREVMKGACLHTDHGSVGTATAENIWRERLIQLKEIGFNAIRCSHNPYPPIVYDLCDKLGFYVIDEVWDKWSYPYVISEWERILYNFLRRDSRHACVVIWSIGNEVASQGSDSMLATLKKFTDYVHAHEPTRPVSCALSQYYNGNQPLNDPNDTRPNAVRAIERIGQYVDVYMLNYHEVLFDVLTKNNPNKTVLSTESFQHYTTAEDLTKNNYEEKTAWMFCEENPGVAGMFLWTGVAYVGESMQWPSRGWPAALIQTNHIRKPASYMYQAYWTQKPMVHIAIVDNAQRTEYEKAKWGTLKLAEKWNYEPQDMLEYIIYSNCEEVQIILNDRERLSKRKTADYINRIVKGVVPYTGQNIRVVGFINGMQVAEHTIRAVGRPIKLTASTNVTQLSSNEYELAYVQVHAIDHNGVVPWTAENLIRFKIEGPGELIAVDNGDLINNYSYQASELPLFRGGVTAIIKAKSGTGTIRVTAESEGLASASVDIQVVETPDILKK